MGAFEEARGSIRDMYDYFRIIEEGSATSLTEYTKDTQINAPVYVQRAVATEEIMLPLMNTLNQLYAGFVVTALGLANNISDTRTIRDAVRSVSTETLVDVEAVTAAEFGNLGKVIVSNEAGAVTLDRKEQSLIASRVIEFDFASKDNNKETKIYMTCTLIPRQITADVVKSVIALKYRPTLRDRWAQLTAGEISFWKDFIMCADILKAEQKGFKQDRTGMLYEILNNANNNLSKALFNVLGLGTPKHNLSNALFIVDKNTMKAAVTKTHFDIENYIGRQKFFLETGMMMLVIVDPMYNLVEIFFNGIKHKGEYTFDMINKIAGGGKGDIDLKQVMTMFGAGSAPVKF